MTILAPQVPRQQVSSMSKDIEHVRKHYLPQKIVISVV